MKPQEKIKKLLHIMSFTPEQKKVMNRYPFTLQDDGSYISGFMGVNDFYMQVIPKNGYYSFGHHDANTHEYTEVETFASFEEFHKFLKGRRWGNVIGNGPKLTKK